MKIITEDSMNFFNHFSQAMENEDLRIDDIFSSDECNIHINGMMNKHICRFLVLEKP